MHAYIQPDDEQAYLAHHKSEASKRLMKSRAEEKKEQDARNSRPVPEKRKDAPVCVFECVRACMCACVRA